MEKLFSIIIPHRNIPNLLQRALDSIPRRNDIQIIVVDDKSDDDIVNFLHFPYLNDKHVEIYFLKENAGNGEARNYALPKAKGKWLYFLDADDFFTPHAFDTLFKYKDSSEDVIVFNYEMRYSDTLELVPSDDKRYITKTRNKYIDDYLNKKNKDTERTLISNPPSACGKMIKKRLVEDYKIKFGVSGRAEDSYFSAVLHYYGKTIYDSSVIYCVTRRLDSVTATPLNKKSLISRHTNHLLINKFYREHNMSYAQKTVGFNFLESIKNGFIGFADICLLTIKYRQNPFIGLSRFIKRISRIN